MSPAFVGVEAVAFSTVNDGVCATGVVKLSSSGGVGIPDGGVTTTDTSLNTSPASTSACVTAIDVHVYCWLSPTARIAVSPLVSPLA